MRVKKAIEVRNQLVNQYHYIIALAKTSKISSSELFEIKTREQKRTPCDTPNWVREFANGYFECLFDQLYEHDLEFCYINSYGEILSTYKDSPRYYEDQGYTPHDLNNMPWSGHFWKGTDKAFSTLRRVNE